MSSIVTDTTHDDTSFQDPIAHDVLGVDNTTEGEHDGYNPMILDVDSQDSDSALGQSRVSSTASMRSSLYESVEENGRTYHKYKEGNYYLPNDEFEQSRLDLQHHLFLMTLDGRLHLAPVKNPQSVLDFGTGTGIWAIDYASQNPSSIVIGTDLSPIQPKFIPPNCEFQVSDASESWNFSQEFNFIHGRAMFSCFKDPLSVFKSAYKALAPGGYLEMQDVFFKPHSHDGTTEGTALASWNEILIRGAKQIGMDWHCVPDYAQMMKEVGFKDIVERKYAWPGNTWPKGVKQKTMGVWMNRNALEGLEAVSLAMMTRSLGMPIEEVQKILENVRRDMNDRSIHAFYPVYIVYGRK